MSLGTHEAILQRGGISNALQYFGVLKKRLDFDALLQSVLVD
jgi:hypothetical protein